MLQYKLIQVDAISFNESVDPYIHFGRHEPLVPELNQIENLKEELLQTKEKLILAQHDIGGWKQYAIKFVDRYHYLIRMAKSDDKILLAEAREKMREWEDEDNTTPRF